MAGESVVSEGEIEKRAQDLEQKQSDEQAAAEKAETDKVAADKVAADKAKADADKVAADEAAKKGGKKEPNDPKELRAWATRTSMELAEVKKQQAELLAAFNKGRKNPIDIKELVKDPAKLEKAIQEREKEIVQEHEEKFNTELQRATAEITVYEDKARYKDVENYPLWADLHDLMTELSNKADSRVNFNQHPKIVLDDLYEVAKGIAEKDPNFKKSAAAAPAATGKTFTQEELDAKVTEARAVASKEAAEQLRLEAKGGGVGSMGKGSGKGKPGEIDKDAMWNMPLNDLGNAVKKATEQLRG